MGVEQLREVLRGLCCSHGWLYGLLWQIRSPDSMLLMPADVYYEDKIEAVIERMLHQVHVVGEGIIGQAAYGGKYWWLYSDTYSEESCLAGLDQCQVGFQDTAEWDHQFSAGIKTIAIIPLSSQSVLQLGSEQRVVENSEFVNCTKNLFRQLGSSAEPLLSATVQSTCNNSFLGLNEASASAIPSFDTIPDFVDIKPFQKEFFEELKASNQCASSLDLAREPFTFGLHQYRSLPCASAQVILSPPDMHIAQMRQQPNSSHSNNLIPSTTMSTSSNDFSTLVSMEQQLSRMGIERPPYQRLPTNSHASGHCQNKMHNIHGASALTSRSLDSAADREDITQFGDEKLSESQHSDMLLESTKGQLSTGNIYASGTPTFPQPLHNSTAFGMLKANSETLNVDILNTLTQWSRSSLGQVNNCWSSEHGGDILQSRNTASFSIADLSGKVTMDTPMAHSIPRSAVEGSLISPCSVSDAKECSWDTSILATGDDVFDSLEDIVLPGKKRSHSNLQTGSSDCISELDMASFSMDDAGFIAEVGHKQLLDAVVCNMNSTTNHCSDNISSISTNSRAGSTSRCSNQIPLSGYSALNGSMGTFLPEFSSEKSPYGTAKDSLTKSLVSSWINGAFSMNSESGVTVQNKRADESSKVARKRARPGESVRPRPKDRQLIQDRVKELREIVPNGAKCSIDSLLDRTVKHMLYLQSVSKYADKLKQVDEPKIIDKETGVVLKDNTSSSSGGTTWAFEVGGQTMVCPIIVEDLNPPGQMLVEMLCEERGFFLEIADIIRGFGLTILKGLMEVRDDKIWARFVVEANREVTRMDIFLSLVQLLQQTTSNNCSVNLPANIGNNEGLPLTKYQPSSVPLPVSLTDNRA